MITFKSFDFLTKCRCTFICRNFSTSIALQGKRNFRKFLLYNKRGSFEHRSVRKMLPDYDLGVRPAGVVSGRSFIIVPEMIPELIVPDLAGFKLKPYVSYRVPDVVQSEFTAKDLFDACYADKIVDDFKTGKLDDNGNSTKPSEDEKRTPIEAWTQARQTGSDMFYEKLPETNER